MKQPHVWVIETRPYGIWKPLAGMSYKTKGSALAGVYLHFRSARPGSVRIVKYVRPDK